MQKTKTLVYVAVESAAGQLTLRGPLPLLCELLAALNCARGDGQYTAAAEELPCTREVQHEPK